MRIYNEWSGSVCVQSYDDAVALLTVGTAVELVVQELYGSPEHFPLKRILIASVDDLKREVYKWFAPVAETRAKEFICGPFTEWDGSSHAYMDGAGFVIHRQAFLDACQHHRDGEGQGARYLFDFLTEWFYLFEVVPVGGTPMGKQRKQVKLEL